MTDLSIRLAGIMMQNPVMPASGCFGYGEEYSRVIDVSRLGAIVTKGTTLNLKEGNNQPRMKEVFGGLINFIGLQNPGAVETIEQKIPIARSFGIPVIVNISGNSIEEFGELAGMFDGVPGVMALEVNISCPNVKLGGVAFGQDPDLVEKATLAARRRTNLPLIVKLTPNVADCVPIAKAAARGGASAFSLINTVKSRAEFSPGVWIEGGLSGPCIMHIALRMVSDLNKAELGLPIIGIGGISCLENALLFFRSGADAVQVGTAIFGNPLVMHEIIDKLDIYIESTGCKSFKEWKALGCPYPKVK